MRRARSTPISLTLGVLLAACGLSVQGIAPEGSADAGAGASPVGPRDSASAQDDAEARDAADGSGDDDDSADASADADAFVDASADADAASLALRALQFDGVDDFVRMSRPVADDFTLEAWIQTTVSGPGPNFWDGPPVFHADVDGPNSDFGSSIQNGKLAFGMGAPDLTVVGATNVATGNWVHVAVTRVKSSGTVTLFVNGVQDGQRTGMSTATLSANPKMDIGANFNNGHFFKGLIDEVRAWNIVRTPAQILATMKAPLDGNEPGLVGYWRFDEASGDVASDTSSIQAHGALGNGDAGARPQRVPSTAF